MDKIEQIAGRCIGGYGHETTRQDSKFSVTTATLAGGETEASVLTSAKVKFSRVWSMPDRDTFSIPPIAGFVQKYLMSSVVSVDPFARNKRWATYTNDLNPETAAEHHLECEDFLRLMAERQVMADLIIFDPPYSPRQVKECYDGIGRKMAQEDAWGGAVRKRRRALLTPIITLDATVLTFGWDTNGMGTGWEIIEIMLVAHGSDHNDTICMAERRLPPEPDLFASGSQT